MGKKPHAVVVPLPAQGHVLPIMELSHRLVERGFRVTLLCTEFDHARMISAAQRNESQSQSQQGIEGISFATFPDGLELEDDRGDALKLSEFFTGSYPRLIEDLLSKIQEREEDKICCVIADLCSPAALSVAKEMGVPRVGFWSASLGTLAQVLHISEAPRVRNHRRQRFGFCCSIFFFFFFSVLVYVRMISFFTGETRLQDQIIQLSPTMPGMSASYLWWNCFSDPMIRNGSFKLIPGTTQTVTLIDEILCNSFAGIEATALDLIPKAIPIGPLLSSNRTVSKIGGHFWADDSSCLAWLDQQQERSVIYVAFGSFAILNQAQFEELGAGLEQTGRPFLWVVRPNLMSGSAVVYPEDFLHRLGTRGKIVSWAPQQKVLSHPAVACFMSHCGWNSTMEGLSNGVPFLCWPYFADQILNQNYICEVWKVGVELKPDEDGTVKREEIRAKTQDLLSDQGVKARAMRIKEMAEETAGVFGNSVRNFDEIVEKIKRLGMIRIGN